MPNFDPDHPLSFSVETANFCVRPNGRPAVWCKGSCPDLADLVGWSLRFVRARDGVALLGFHMSLVYEHLPFATLATFGGMSPVQVGLCEASRYLDVVVMDRDARIRENFVFTCLDRSVLAAPPRPVVERDLVEVTGRV